MFGYLLKIRIILLKNKGKDSRESSQLFPPFNTGMHVRNSPFVGILNSFAETSTKRWNVE